MSVFIIAEAGVNHNGSPKLAFQLIDEAFRSGADAVKFQTFKAENLVTTNASKANYQKEFTNKKESQFEMLKKLELDENTHKKLISYCNELGMTFLSSPFDIDSIDMLNNLGVNIFKIPSGEITNFPYLNYIGALKKKIIISTGMSNLEEVREALRILTAAGTLKKDITVLHANTMYPTPPEDVNLKAMLTLNKEFNVDVGYSDHTLGIEIDIAATAMGAKCIEKHFTLNKELVGPDHKASLDPNEFTEMVNAIRVVEKALGDGNKKPSSSEIINMNVVRKSIVAKKKIKKGSLITEKNITTKRPGDGISPMKWDEVVGTIAKKDYNKNDFI